MLTVNGSDISSAVIWIEVNEKVNSGAAVLKFAVLKSEAEKLKNGDKIVFAENGDMIFVGKIFSRSIGRYIAEIAAFDSIADLKTVLPVKRNSGKASVFVQEIFSLADQFVKTGAVDQCDTELVPDQYKSVSLLNILYRVIDETAANGQRFVLHAEGDIVTFRNEKFLECSCALNGNNIIDFDYEHSAEDCCNFVKLISNNADKGYDDVAVAKNEASIQQLGIRSITKKVYEKNPEQLVDMAKKLLLEHGIEREKITVNAVGNLQVRAGYRVWCDINGAGAFWARVISSRHRLERGSYFMQLELERTI